MLSCVLVMAVDARQIHIDTCEPGSATATLDNGAIRVEAVNRSGFRRWGDLPASFTLPGYPDYLMPVETKLWVSGNVHDSLRVSGHSWSFINYWPGVLPEPGSDRQKCDDYGEEWNRVWVLTRSEAEMLGTDQPNARVRSWPTHLGAPYSSTESDQSFDPEKGDRPLIRGDRALWWTLTDHGGPRPYDGRSVGVQVQVSPFLFDRTDMIGETLFVHYRITNANPVPVTDAFVGLWKDGMVELNGPFEATATDSVLGMGYHFFKDNVWHRPSNGPDPDVHPAFGVLSIRARRENGEDIPLHAIMTPHGDDIGFGVKPRAQSIRNLMSGLFENGNPVLVGGGLWGMGYPGHSTEPYQPRPGEATTRFPFSGNPLTGSFWSAYDVDGNGTPLDSRALSLVLSHGPFDFEPGETIDFVVAFVFGIEQDHLESIRTLRERATILKFNAKTLLEYSTEAPVRFDPDRTHLRMSEAYPNPASDVITIRHDLQGALELTIIDTMGRVHRKDRFRSGGPIQLDVSLLPAGLYFARIQTGMVTGVRRFTVVH